MVDQGAAAPQLVLANFASALAVDLSESAVLQKWATQAPREIWLLRPGDLLVTPVRPSEAFLASACGLLGMARADIDVVTVPDLPGAAMADSVRRAGLLPALTRWARERPGARLLPVALDAPTTRLAHDLGIGVAPYPDAAPPSARTVAAVMDLNTKSGFRTAARAVGLRIPPGETCAAADLGAVVRSRLAAHGSVVVKPDRAAGGHGVHFLTEAGSGAAGMGERTGEAAETTETETTTATTGTATATEEVVEKLAKEAAAAAASGTASRWVVERLIPHHTSLSAQFTVESTATHWEFDGTMAVRDGAFTGYRSPLPAPAAAEELREWGTRFGDRLAARGYRGPFGIDALIAEDGSTLYATEVNVRRTATTTPYALVRRLADASRGALAWRTGHTPGGPDASFGQAHARLTGAGLAYRREAGEGVVLYADVLPDVPVRHLTIAATADRAAELEDLARRALCERSPDG